MDKEKLLQQYAWMLEHGRHMENRAFSTLGHFLTANAFLIAAWAQLFTGSAPVSGAPTPSVWMSALLLLIPAIGYFTGLAWGLLGVRNWGYARRIMARLIGLGVELSRSGAVVPLFRDLFGVELAVHRKGAKAEDLLDARRATPGVFSNPGVLLLVPLAISLIDIGLAVVVGVRDSGGGVLGAVGWAVAVVGLIGVLALFVLGRCEYARAEAEVLRARREAFDAGVLPVAL